MLIYRHTRLCSVAVGISLLLATAVHAQQPAARGTSHHTLTVVGTHLFAPLIGDISKRFESLRPGVSLDMKPDDAANGLRELRAGAAHIAMVPRPLLPGEADLFAFPVARDGVAVVVHRDNYYPPAHRHSYGTHYELAGYRRA